VKILGIFGINNQVSSNIPKDHIMIMLLFYINEIHALIKFYTLLGDRRRMGKSFSLEKKKGIECETFYKKIIYNMCRRAYIVNINLWYKEKAI
jgi:hypothetical protein